MNQGLQLPNRQDERYERQLSQEINIQVHQSLCELQSSLMNYVNWTYKGRVELSLNQENNNERWRSLNWENPGQAEYETVSEILKKLKKLIQQDFNQRRDTSLNQLLMDLLRSLWKYFLFNSARWRPLRPNSTSLNNHREWRQFERATVLLPTNLQRNVHDRGTKIKQDLRMILYYLKESRTGWRTQDLQSSRYNEDDEFGIHPAL